MTALKSQAIQTALMGDWENAISLNQQILSDTPDDIDTLNRLAYAYASKGDSKEAKNIYQKVLELDTQNPIAIRNLKRLSISNGKANSHFTPMQMGNLFIEEPGKTKVIELINVADKKVISPLRSGEVLQLQIKRMKIFVLDEQKQYIGMLPDDIGRRLIKFIEGGNKYEAYVKSVENNKVIIFAKEAVRVKQFENQSPFPATDKHKKFTLDHHDRIDDDEERDTSHKRRDTDMDDDKPYSDLDGDDTESL